MFKKFKFDHFSAITDSMGTYFKKKTEDCILYAEDGSNFKIHKELLGQTVFLRKVLSTANNQGCSTIEIICPCTKEELARLVHFLYHGEIQCDNVFDSIKSQEDLSKIFGFQENFNIESQIAMLLDDPVLSSILDTALSEEIVNSVDDKMITQSSEINFVVKDEVCLNFEYAHGSVLEKKTVENTRDEITLAIDHERIAPKHVSMVDKICPTEVEIDLNNNIVNETGLRHGVNENLESVVMNEELLNNFISNNALFTGSMIGGIDLIDQHENQDSVSDKDCETEANKCNHCNYCSKNKSDMNRHVNQVHLMIKPYSCKSCEYSFYRKSDIERHVNSVHLKIRLFTCRHCDKSFGRKNYLKMHTDLVHLHLKSFECQYCDRSFITKQSVKKHIDGVHFYLKPFSCYYCEKAFAQKGNLKAHIEVKHWNKRPRNCNLCRISFIQKSHFKQHIVEIHKNLKPLKCVKPDLNGPLVFLKKLEFQEE